jgi:hypothetical protein
MAFGLCQGSKIPVHHDKVVPPNKIMSTWLVLPDATGISLIMEKPGDFLIIGWFNQYYKFYHADILQLPLWRQIAQPELINIYMHQVVWYHSKTEYRYGMKIAIIGITATLIMLMMAK